MNEFTEEQQKQIEHLHNVKTWYGKIPFRYEEFIPYSEDIRRFNAADLEFRHGGIYQYIDNYSEVTDYCEVTYMLKFYEDKDESYFTEIMKRVDNYKNIIDTFKFKIDEAYRAASETRDAYSKFLIETIQNGKK